MFDKFSDPTLPLQGGLWGPKDNHFDRKLWFFANVVLCLVPNPKINTKTDLNV